MERPIVARDIMVTRLITLPPRMDVFEAIGLLLKHRISGAPVVDEAGGFLGVFSEKCSMGVLLDAAYDSLPTTEVHAFMDRGPRTITEETDLLTIAQIFQSTNYRRLPVLRDGKLVGQISRRDVLQAAHRLSEQTAPNPERALLYLSSLVDRDDAPIG